MILTPQQRKEFELTVEPLMEWLAQNCHPHTAAIVDSGRAELVEGVVAHVTSKFIRD